MTKYLYDYISAEESGDSQRTATLSQDCNQYNDLSLVTTSMNPYNVSITRITNARKPKSLKLTAPEADAFVVAWTTFKADIEAAKQALETQRKEDLAQALKLAREMKEALGDLGTLEIKKHAGSDDEPTSYKVSLPALGWTYNSGYRNVLYTGTEVLSGVKSALEQIKNHIHIIETSPVGSAVAKERNERWMSAWKASQFGKEDQTEPPVILIISPPKNLN